MSAVIEVNDDGDATLRLTGITREKDKKQIAERVMAMNGRLTLNWIMFALFGPSVVKEWEKEGERRYRWVKDLAQRFEQERNMSYKQRGRYEFPIEDARQLIVKAIGQLEEESKR